MKKKLLSLAIAGASLVAANSYAAGPTVYGKLNVSLNQIDTEEWIGTDAETDEDTWKLLSNASRLGVTGDVDINSSLKAIYKLEYEVSVDGDDDEFRQRNIYVGLQGKSWGTLLAGKHDSPLKLAQGKADQFNDYYLADIKFLMVGENRPNDTVMYTTPNMGGFMLTAAIMPGEETEVDGSDESADDGIADHASVALEFKIDALRLAAAVDSDVNNNDAVRLVAEFTPGQFELGAIYQMAESSDDDISIADFGDYFDDLSTYSISTLVGDMEQDAFIISGAFKVHDKLKLKAQVGMAETDFAVNGSPQEETLEIEQISIGADYSLAASTTLYGYYTNLAWDYTEADVDGDGNTFGIGIDHKF